ncbi:MAG: glycosyltransferase family 4 protein [Acidimicrobiales bacterium]|jgi:glycosyltransferase involved in cell wall biosynthesis
MNVTLFFSGLDARGGISPDVRLLESGLLGRGVAVTATGSLREVWRRTGAKESILDVYGCLPSPKTLLAMAMAARPSCRLVWTPVFHPRRREVWKGAGAYRLMEVFDRLAPHIARLVDGVSAATEEEAAYFEKMGARRTRVIPLVAGAGGHPLQGEARLAARRRHGLAAEPLILMVAAHSPRRKGMSFAAETMRHLRRRHPAARVLVVGGGDAGPLAHEPGVVAAGWCSDEVLESAYRSADVLFVPSLYEQFSRATIEAWSYELPVVMSDGVALAVTAGAAGAGLVVPYGDARAAAAALDRVISDELLRRSMGVAGRALVDERFVLDKHVEASLELFNAVVAGAGGRRSVEANDIADAPTSASN